MKKTIPILLFSAALFVCSDLNAQCKNFAKRNCLPELSPYLSNGQMNAAHLVPGESASVSLNLNKGLSYRILICADTYLEGMTYSFLNQAGTSFKQDTLKEGIAITDLQVKQSGAYQIELEIPEKKNATGIIRNGCVTILIGFKD